MEGTKTGQQEQYQQVHKCTVQYLVNIILEFRLSEVVQQLTHATTCSFRSPMYCTVDMRDKSI